MSMLQTKRSRWSEWILSPEYQQYYRQRVDSSGNAHIQWQSEYEAAQSSQVPRSEGMDEMTQQFGAASIQSPEQNEEPNYVEYAVTGSSSSGGKNRTSRSKSKPSKTSSGKGKGPAQEDIDEVDERDHQGYESRYSQNRSAAPQAEQVCKCLSEAMVYRWHRRGSQNSLDWDPNTRQYYPYTQAGQVAQEEEDEPGPVAPSGNPEHIVGTGGDAEKLDPRGGSIVEETVYRDQYGGPIFVHFRRFIVVANDLGHCTCIPISTYGKKGCKKSGVKAEQHGIVAESSNRNPTPLSNEPSLGFPPVRVHIYEQGERISKESRVNYAKLTTVEHNVKVLFIGRVVGSDWEVVTDAVNTSWAKKMHTHKKKHRSGR
ncbi:uncharacterized protein QYS62_008627 [Fusarium acuminatum]|uniref:DUF6590 domain-containing protein n=1 Tax=Fusarium acuminatum TaxID=5515 RepID=A0ABZ2X624_9HYPO